MHDIYVNRKWICGSSSFVEFSKVNSCKLKMDLWKLKSFVDFFKSHSEISRNLHILANFSEIHFTYGRT